MTSSNKKNVKSFTRRDFLKGMGGGALGTSIATRLLPGSTGGVMALQEDIPLYSKKRVSIEINGKMMSLVVEPRETLLDVLRDRINLTGTKTICNRGECGGCTVLMDGKPIYSCMFLAIRADGTKITTIEGLSKGEKLHPIQEAFVKKDGYQCGFCTPGFIMTASAFLDKNNNPDLNEVKNALSGNLCRCGNYVKIFSAIKEAAETMRRA